MRTQGLLVAIAGTAALGGAAGCDDAGSCFEPGRYELAVSGSFAAPDEAEAPCFDAGSFVGIDATPLTVGDDLAFAFDDPDLTPINYPGECEFTVTQAIEGDYPDGTHRTGRAQYTTITHAGSGLWEGFGIFELSWPEGECRNRIVNVSITLEAIE